MSFGEYLNGSKFRVLDERVVRASAGIMLAMASIAFINVAFLDRFFVITIVSGALLLNFSIGIFINPKYAPTIILGKYIVKSQSPLPIGAIQKKFAWSLDLVLAIAIFILSLFLLKDVKYFEAVCLLCLNCLGLLYLESVFGICIGCKLYRYALKYKLLPQPEANPNCMGDSCDV